MPSELYQALPGVSTLTDLSAKQFYAVTPDTSNALTVKAVSAVTDRPIGILQDNPKGATGAPMPATVAYSGVAKAIAGASGWTRGDRLGVDSGGALVTITEAIATNDNAYTVAIALDSASSGDIARVLILTAYLSNHQ